jgi:hypothetical protein
MTREEILAEIRRTAKENGGVPLGRDRLEHATGIKPYDWQKYWSRFGDAQREAGFEPNRLQAAYSDEYLITRVIQLIRDLGRFPTIGEIRVRKHSESEFPSVNAFARFGKKSEFAAKVLEYCDSKPEYAEVADICRSLATPRSASDIAQEVSRPNDIKYGFVYLIKGHPGEFKIGHTNLVDRRVSELGATFPIEQQLIHTIKTDDPAGVEAYWHRRFENKRMKGEWFRLKPDDVRAFKRWKRIL